MSSGATRILKPRERSTYGVTLSIQERTTGEERVIVVTGMLAMPALREAVRQIDALEGDWFVRAFSTPETIHSDLIGRSLAQQSVPPEHMMLSRIGRMDLLERRPIWARGDGRRAIHSGGT